MLYRLEAEFKDMLAHITFGMVAGPSSSKIMTPLLLEDSAYNFLKELVF
jgi:hypothetical protein